MLSAKRHYLNATSFNIMEDGLSFLSTLASILKIETQVNANRKDAPTYFSELVTKSRSRSVAARPTVCVDHVHVLPTDILTTMLRMMRSGAFSLITISHRSWVDIHWRDSFLQPQMHYMSPVSSKTAERRLLAFGEQESMGLQWSEWCAFMRQMNLLNTETRTLGRIFELARRFYPEFKALPREKRTRELMAKLKTQKEDDGPPKKELGKLKEQQESDDESSKKEEIPSLHRKLLLATYIASRLSPDKDAALFAQTRKRKRGRTTVAKYQTIPHFSMPDRIMSIGTTLDLWSEPIDLAAIHVIVFAFSSPIKKVNAKKLKTFYNT